ncbi:MAG: glycosyltransferase [Enterocloster clostridioformis]
MRNKKAIRIIEDYKPDIIHIHNIHGNYINIKITFSYLKKCGIPIVWTMHDCWPFTGHCPHYIYNACYKWRDDVCSKCPRKKEYPASYLRIIRPRNFLEKENYSQVFRTL